MKENLKVLRRLILLVLMAAAASASLPAQDGITWKSWAELGGGVSLAGGEIRPMAVAETGIFIGPVELGSYLQLIPLEFGTPDLIQAAGLVYGGTIGFSPAYGNAALKPFGRLGLGGILKDEADKDGAFDGKGVERGFACSFALGVELPLGGRWSTRVWGAYLLAPGFTDFGGTPLSGLNLGMSIRAAWTTTLR